jgi:hypothetical protein
MFSYLRREAKARYGLARLPDAEPGALVAIQRFGSALNLNVHLHVIAPDGVFVQDGDSVGFLKLGRPSEEELRAVAWETCRKTLSHLRKQGRWLDLEEGAGIIEGDDPLALDAPFLADIYGASIAGRLALGPRSGERLLTFVSNPPRSIEPRPKGVMGFDAHAGTYVNADQRGKLERLCRYLFRPPAGVDRFEELPDGRVSLRLKRPWSDGTTKIVLTSIELVEKLAALVPPPRVNQVRYFGVFAPRSKMRDRILPASDDTASDGGDERAPCEHRQRWAILMRRVFNIDVLECPKCKSQMQQIAFITQPGVIQRILKSVGHPADSPVVA